MYDGVEVKTFPRGEKKVLQKDGAVIYLLRRETIRAQRQAGEPFWHIAVGFELGEGKDSVLDATSRLIEVAFYPDPSRFFVQGSFNKSMAKQKIVLAEDLEEIKRRTGLEIIDQIFPEAPEATQVMFRHFKETSGRVRLLGKNYIHQYISTITPITPSRSHFAVVGAWFEGSGVDVSNLGIDSASSSIGAARWIVPVGIS